MAATTIEQLTEVRASGATAQLQRRLEAWLSIPEADRAELINGRIVYKAMATVEHGTAAGNVFAQLDRFQGPPGDGVGGWWLSQDVDMFLAGQGIRPDVVGWRMDRHPKPPQKVNVGSKHLGVYVTPPDWVCAVLSVSTRSRDDADGAKWQAYLEVGVSHYWLVDLSPGHEQITVYRRTARGYEPIEVARRDAVKPLPPFEAIPFQAQRMFMLAEMIRGAPR